MCAAQFLSSGFLANAAQSADSIAEGWLVLLPSLSHASLARFAVLNSMCSMHACMYRFPLDFSLVVNWFGLF